MATERLTARQMLSSEATDVLRAVAFHNAIWQDERTPEHWRWQYAGTDPNRSVFALLEEGGELVATQGMIPLRLNIAGQICYCGKSESSAVAHSHRGRGLFALLYRFAIDVCRDKGMTCIVGYTSVPAALKVLGATLGFSIYRDRLGEAVLVLHLRPTLSAIWQSRWPPHRKVAASAMCLLAMTNSVALRLPRKPQEIRYRVCRRQGHPDDVLELYSRLRTSHPRLIHLQQDPEYTAWRLQRNPTLRYTTYCVYEDTALRAYCHVNTNRDRVAHLAHVTFEVEDAGALLLRCVIDELYRGRIGYIRYLGNETNPLMAKTFALLRRFGFLHTRSASAFVLKNLSYPDEDPLLDIANWYLDGLWTEGYTF